MTTTQPKSGAGALVAPALCFRDVSFRYHPDRPEALSGVDFQVAPGEFVALVGGNGSGKSTVARLSNGLLAPAAGEVEVGGLATSDVSSLWEVRARVGLLFQDPEDQIVGATVEDDVAFGLENLGVPREEMRRRVTDTLDLVRLGSEGDTEPHLLSGGQKQRLALAGVLVLRPTILVLDEPTSMLDPSGREEMLDFFRKLAGQGVAIVMITQHMAEAARADRLLALDRGRLVHDGAPRAFFDGDAFVRLPLGRPPARALAARVFARTGSGPTPVEGAPVGVVPAGLESGPGWSLALTEEELVGSLLELAGRGASDGSAGLHGDGVAVFGAAAAPSTPPTGRGEAADSPDRPSAVELRGVTVTYNERTPLERRGLVDVDLVIPEACSVAVVGATASGKSTLLQVVAGLLRPNTGERSWAGARKPGRGEVGMVFQRPETQLFKSTVWEDVAVAPRLHGLEGTRLSARVSWALEAVDLDPEAFGPRTPHGLSLGERRRVALAGILSLDPRLLVLDEPGAGLDPPARRRLMSFLRRWVGDTDGHPRTLVWSSHDLDEVATTAERVIVVREGRVVAHGTARSVLSDEAALEEAALRPPIAARVARRLGARPDDGVINGAALVEWLERRGLPS